MDQIQTQDGQETENESPQPPPRQRDKKCHLLLAPIHSQPSTADAVHFFNSPVGVHYSDDDEEEKGDSVEQQSDDVRLTVQDDVHLVSSAMGLTGYQPALYYPASCAGLVTLSSQFPVSLEDKLDDVTQLWSPEEDGLYVGCPPKCSQRRWRILERRLVTQTAGDKDIKTKWFRSDGTVAVLPDPLRPYLVRNIISTTVAQDLRPVYLPNGKKEGGDGVKQLEKQAYPLHVFVSGLAFDHHWLFGQENVVAARLRRRWAVYTSTDGDQPSAAKMDVLARKLRALYQAHDEAVDLLDRLQFNGADAAVMTAQLQRIASYREAIGWTRGDYYSASARRLALVRSMVADWKQLKALRKSQGFSCTSCKLVVHKMNAADRRSRPSPLDWDEEIERQMDESRRLFREHVRDETDRYKRQKAQWRTRRRKRATRKKKSKVNSSSESEEDKESEKSETDDEKPEAPPERHFDEVQTRADIVKIMEESLTPPGEAPLNLSWAQITPTASNNEREKRRMEAIKKCVYQLKIFVNGEETSVSDIFHLSEEFTAEDIQQAFHIWIRDKPRNISMQLSYKTHQNMKKWLPLADVTVPIPSSRASFASQPESELKFQSNLVQSSVDDLGNVGCGLRREEEADWTTGILVVKAGWGTDARGNVIAPVINTPTAPKGATDPTEWVNHVQLDLNDPANAETLDKIEKLKRLEWRGSSGKAMTEVLGDDEESFCTKEQFDSNVRFQLLRRRADETKPFAHLTMIPSRPDEIPNHLIHMVDGSGTTGSSFERMEDEDSLNPLDVIRRRGQRKWLKIYPMVADRLSSSSQKRLQLADLVMEDHIPDMSTFGGQLMPVFFKAHRPLRPERKERNPVPLLAGLTLSSSEQVSVKVNVIRALNLPHKIDRNEHKRQDSGDVMVHPFVEVTFQKTSTRTTAGNGSSPTWNQELNLPIQFPEGIRSLAYLQSIRDDLFIQLFDEVVVDILDDDRQRDVSVHQRYERHWLGGFKIPFQVVYKWSKIEGTFALNIPLVPIGYQYNHSNHDGPLLTVLISVYPAVCPLRLGQHKGPSMEDEGFVDYVNGWRDGLVKEFPCLAGLINPLVINEKAMTVYVGRYLTPLEPPEELTGSSDEETLRNLCQFVSSIPSASNNQPVLLPRIWLTCQTVFEWLVGGDEERAVLLHNYLAHLRYEVYVLVGMSVPEGETAYVLYKDKTNHAMRMINPSTGFVTNVTDPTCSMQQVWTLFNQNDFWVNTHSKVHPSQLQYQVLKVSDWRPLFSRRFPNPKLTTVQSPEDLLYPATSAKDIRQLEESIIDHLKQYFMKWRKTVRTKWNRHASLVFRDILSQAARGDSTPISDNLEELLESYKVFGVPLKTAYVDLESLSDLLYATGLHRHHGIEFALSVFVKSYPNHLLHVFIYCAYLENL